MRIRHLFFASAVLLSAIVGSPRAGGSVKTLPPPSQPPPSGGAAAPRLALLATRPGALHTSLYLAGPDEAASAPVATFTHLAGATVRAAVLAGTSVVLATADTVESRDLSFNAGLYRLAPHMPPELLCDGVVHASRPVVSRDGRVFVARGAAGAVPGSSRLADMRVDALTIDEVDVYTGRLRTVHGAAAYVTHLAGAFGEEVIAYRVGPDGADIAAIDADTGAVRLVVASLPPFARDFSVDSETGTLVFQNRHESDSRTWVIERVDLGSGARSRLHESSSMNLVPFAVPGGALAYSPEGRGGLTIAGTAVHGPMGPGADWVLAAEEGARWLAALHLVPGGLSTPFLVDLGSGRSMPVRGLEGARIAVAGFVSGEGGAR